MTKECKVYIIIFEDDAVQLFPVPQRKKDFDKDATCYSCSYKTTIDEVREFVTLKTGKELFKKEW